jgi:hypothetical protein
MTHMSREGGVNKARGLLTIYRFLEITMEKGVLDIHLMNGPGVRGGKTKQKANSGGLHNGTEGLIIINTVLLCETTHDPPSFVTSKRAVSVEFMAENPFAGHHIDTCRTRN